MPRQTGTVRCAYAGCGHLTGGEPYCGNHVKKCDAFACHRRVRQGTKFCQDHLDYGRPRCQHVTCRNSAAPGSDFCGNHRHECTTPDCTGRTRDGGICTQCSRNTKLAIADSVARRQNPDNQTARGQLRELIRTYEERQGDSGIMGQIARERIPVLRRELQALQGVQR